MTLLERLKESQLLARKTKVQSLVALLTTLLGDCLKVGKDNGNREPTDDEIISVVKKTIANIEFTMSKCDDSRIGIKKQCELDLIVLKSYLPTVTVMSEVELIEVIKTIITERKCTNIGSVMTVLKNEYKNQYDGKTANTIIKQLLEN